MAFQFALPRAGVALLLALAAEPVRSQVYKLEQDPVPAPYSLSMQYLFYVYGPEDSPNAVPSVEFRQLEAHKTPEGTLPRSYSSLEVSIMPYDKFWGLVNKDKFCASQEDVARNLAARCCQLMLATPAYQTLADLGVRTQRVPVGSEAETVAFPIASTGSYALVVSNCGNYSGATFTGSVAVKNGHGYLPAYAFNAMRVAGCLAVLSTAIFAVWTRAVVRCFQSLIYIQKGILVVSLLSVLEAFSTWLTYQDWNATGQRRDSLFFASLLFYTLKYVLSWRFLLLAAVGAEGVLEDLDWKTSIISQVASAVFGLQACAWRLIVSYRFSHALASTFLLLATFPGVAIYAGMFLWTYLHFSSLADRMKEQKREELSGILEKVRVILVTSFLLSCFNATLQILDIGGDLFSWGLAWLPVEGAPQISFVGALAAMMVVWWPSEANLKYGYEVQVNDGEDEAVVQGRGSRVWMDEEQDDNVQSDSRELTARTKPNAVAPEAIGAREEEEESGKGRDSVDLL